MDEKNETKYMLEDALQTQIAAINEAEFGSKERSVMIDDLVKMYRVKIDEQRMEWEFSVKYEEHKDKKPGKYDRAIDIGLKISGLVIQPLVFIYLFREGLKFETTGSYTSFGLRSLLSKSLRF